MKEKEIKKPSTKKSTTKNQVLLKMLQLNLKK